MDTLQSESKPRENQDWITAQETSQDQFGVAKIPAHKHSGVDSLRVDVGDLERFPSTAAVGNTIQFNGNQWIATSAGSNPTDTNLGAQLKNTPYTNTSGHCQLQYVRLNAAVGSADGYVQIQFVVDGNNVDYAQLSYADGAGVNRINTYLLVMGFVPIGSTYEVQVQRGGSGNNPNIQFWHAINF